MKFCMHHWGKMAAAMRDRGLSHLCSKNNKPSLADMKVTKEPRFDPLTYCHWMMLSEALKIGGAYVMMRKADGSRHCPVCEATKRKPQGVIREDGGELLDEDIEKLWINGAADTALEQCRQLKLVPPEQ